MKRAIALNMLGVGLIAVSTVRAHEKVKLTGYVVDVVCAADHTFPSNHFTFLADERRKGTPYAHLSPASILKGVP